MRIVMLKRFKPIRAETVEQQMKNYPSRALGIIL